MMELITLVRPLLVKYSVIKDKFDEDLYQYIIIRLISAITNDFEF